MLPQIRFPVLALATLAILAATARPVSAQFSVEGKAVEIHGFASQGFAYSNQNNYLTMPTSTGSFAFTDAGVNLSSRITDRFRVGAQAYVRNIGELGRGRVRLDWALGDYRFSDAFGIRAGRVKTVFGLYNDTQDVESLHTWAILPQSIYPLDLRETSLSHLGGDIYGHISIGSAGQLAYTAYAGTIVNDRNGGYAQGLRSQGLNPRAINGNAKGADLKWTTPVSGLLVGVSFLNTQLRSDNGDNLFTGAPFSVRVPNDYGAIASAQYTFRNLRLDAELGRGFQKIISAGVYGPDGLPAPVLSQRRKAWYVAGAYRISKRLELGAYHSRFYPDSNRASLGPLYLPPEMRHIFDQTIALRVDLLNHWDLKLEGHFIDGYGSPASIRGFYPLQNPSGLRPTTNLLVVRTGVNF